MDLSLITYHLILPLLEFFKTTFGNYGWSIIFVTIFIKAILVPLSIKQALSTKKSQEKLSQVKPEMDHVQEKYNLRKKKHENDPEKLAEVQKEFQAQLMEIYQKSGGFNPLGGCLPLLLQLPIIIALYWAFCGSPFQATVMSMPLEITNKVFFLDNKTKPDKSATVNFVDSNGKLGRYQIESNVYKRKILLDKEYSFEVKKLEGAAEFNPSSLYWRIDSAKANKQKIASMSPEELKENQALSIDGEKVIEMQNVKNQPDKIILKGLKITEPFSLEAVLINSRGQERFFFIKDLGRSGVYNQATGEIHWDILILLIIFIATLYLSGILMGNQSPKMPSLDPKQEEIQKQTQKQMQIMLPLMSVGFFLFIPLPAAVFLYFCIGNIFQIIQSYFTNKMLNLNNN